MKGKRRSLYHFEAALSSLTGGDKTWQVNSDNYFTQSAYSREKPAIVIQIVDPRSKPAKPAKPQKPKHTVKRTTTQKDKRSDEGSPRRRRRSQQVEMEQATLQEIDRQFDAFLKMKQIKYQRLIFYFNKWNRAMFSSLIRKTKKTQNDSDWGVAEEIFEEEEGKEEESFILVISSDGQEREASCSDEPIEYQGFKGISDDVAGSEIDDILNEEMYDIKPASTESRAFAKWLIRMHAREQWRVNIVKGIETALQKSEVKPKYRTRKSPQPEKGHEVQITECVLEKPVKEAPKRERMIVVNVPVELKSQKQREKKDNTIDTKPVIEEEKVCEELDKPVETEQNVSNLSDDFEEIEKQISEEERMRASETDTKESVTEEVQKSDSEISISLQSDNDEQEEKPAPDEADNEEPVEDILVVLQSDNEGPVKEEVKQSESDISMDIQSDDFVPVVEQAGGEEHVASDVSVEEKKSNSDVSIDLELEVNDSVHSDVTSEPMIEEPKSNISMDIQSDDFVPVVEQAGEEEQVASAVSVEEKKSESDISMDIQSDDFVPVVEQAGEEERVASDVSVEEKKSNSDVSIDLELEVNDSVHSDVTSEPMIEEPKSDSDIPVDFESDPMEDTKKDDFAAKEPDNTDSDVSIDLGLEEEKHDEQETKQSASDVSVDFISDEEKPAVNEEPMKSSVNVSVDLDADDTKRVIDEKSESDVSIDFLSDEETPAHVVTPEHESSDVSVDMDVDSNPPSPVKPNDDSEDSIDIDFVSEDSKDEFIPIEDSDSPVEPEPSPTPSPEKKPEPEWASDSDSDDEPVTPSSTKLGTAPLPQEQISPSLLSQLKASLPPKPQPKPLISAPPKPVVAAPPPARAPPSAFRNVKESKTREYIRQFFSETDFTSRQDKKAREVFFMSVQIPSNVNRPFTISPEYSDVILDLINELIEFTDISGFTYETFLDKVESLLNTQTAQSYKQHIKFMDVLNDTLCEEDELEQVHLMIEVADAILQKQLQTLLQKA